MVLLGYKELIHLYEKTTSLFTTLKNQVGTNKYSRKIWMPTWGFLQKKLH